MDVLVTGGDTELGRAVAEGFRDAGHTVTLAGARRDELEVAAKELEADAIVCDTHRPRQPCRGPRAVPASHRHHRQRARRRVGTPVTRACTRCPDLAAAWRNSLDATVLSAVLTVQTVGDHLRSGGSIISVVPENPRAGSAEAAIKAALSNWVAGQATIFGTRGITVNAVAAGRGAQPGYDGLSGTPPSVAAEVARLALFLTSSAARHITGQMLHVSHGALTQFA